MVSLLRNIRNMCFRVYVDNIRHIVSKQRPELFCSDGLGFPNSGIEVEE